MPYHFNKTSLSSISCKYRFDWYADYANKRNNVHVVEFALSVRYKYSNEAFVFLMH